MKNDIGIILLRLAQLDFKSKDVDMFLPMIVAMIPTSLIALVLLEFVEAHLKDVLYVAIAFMANGAILYYSRERHERRYEIGYVAAVAIGIAQGIAIIPGISRSGATIGVALMLGIRRERAFRFSLLLSIPAVIGALLATLYTEYDRLLVAGFDFTQVLLGIVVTALAGYLGLRMLWKALAKNSLQMFAFYCLPIGTALALLSLRVF
jgi:undecaprenyl-diphosphatase